MCVWFSMAVLTHATAKLALVVLAGLVAVAAVAVVVVVVVVATHDEMNCLRVVISPRGMTVG